MEPQQCIGTIADQEVFIGAEDFEAKLIRKLALEVSELAQDILEEGFVGGISG